MSFVLVSGGLKGVGEAAVESIIAERVKGGHYLNIFDFIKRINQERSIKRHWRAWRMLAGSIVFLNITVHNYFNLPEGETVTGLERVIKYGQVIATQNSTTANTLFGDLPITMEIPPPRLPECEHWSLTRQIDHEKEVTGMFLSGHPLDHYRFEMKHYGITSIADFNEFREAIKMHPNPGRTFRILGLVADAQHRLARSGNKYGNFIIEDYSGKTEFPLFSEKYLKISPFLPQGSTVLITGYFKQRYNKDEFEFDVQQVSLAETLKKNLTRQLNIEVHPQDISKEMVDFVEKNMRSFRGGKTTLSFIFNRTEEKPQSEPDYQVPNTFEMNEDLIHYLEAKPELEVQVVVS